MRPRVLFFLLLLSGCSTPDPSIIQPLVQTQLDRYPEMEIQDAYKFLHQAAMGNRHLGVEDSLIYNYLTAELNSIAASEAEPLIEYISPDSQVVRLNLRPFKASGGSVAVLFASMKATWEKMEPAPDRLAFYGHELTRVAGDTPFDAGAISEYFAGKQEEGFPAVHHSSHYEKQYAPAYRVLLREFIP